MSGGTYDDVGSGHDFGVSLHHLFMAGRVELPAAAEVHSSIAWEVEGLQDRLRTIATRLHQPAGLAEVDGTRATVQGALSLMATNLDAAGDALVVIAQDYAATDAEAGATFQARQDALTGDEAAAVAAPETDPTPPPVPIVGSTGRSGR